MVLVVKNPPAIAGDIRDVGLTPRSVRSPGEGHDNPLQYSYLENPMDRGAWQATAHRVAQSWIQLKRISMHVQAPFIYELIKSPPKLFEIIILSPFYRRGDWEFK